MTTKERALIDAQNTITRGLHKGGLKNFNYHEDDSISILIGDCEVRIMFKYKAK